MVLTSSLKTKIMVSYQHYSNVNVISYDTQKFYIVVTISLYLFKIRPNLITKTVKFTQLLTTKN